jgi:EmrB/QacA subfamily drug resistance transporter
MKVTATYNSHGERRSWATLVLLCVAQFMVVLDITIVNVALPSIGKALHFAPSDLQWVVTAYVICSGGLLLIGSRAGDLLGRRQVFVAGLLMFTAASLASGLAPSAGFLVAARALQGVGAAMLTPAALSIVMSSYSGSQRASALTIWGLIASAGIGVGSLAGGMITSWLSWEWVFLVNVPVGVVAAALTPRLVPNVPRVPGGRPLDVPGALSAVSGLAVLVYALAGVPDHGWGSSRTLALLALAAGLLAAFWAIERRAARPLLPPATWRVRSLVVGAAMMLGATGLVAGTFYLNSVYLQGVLGWSALDTGLGFLPFVAATAAGVHAASHLLPRLATRRLVVIGMALVAIAAVELALAPDRAGYVAYLLPGFIALGTGLGLAFPAIQISAMSDVDHDRAGIASGLIQTSHEVGAALGIAVVSAIAVSGSHPGATFGYGNGFAAAAVIAVALGLLAAVSLASVRPAPGAAVALH